MVNGKSNINIGKECPACGKTTRLDLDFTSYYLWKRGTLIQDAFPDLSSTDRETLMSGICPECQKQFFDELEEFKG